MVGPRPRRRRYAPALVLGALLLAVSLTALLDERDADGRVAGADDAPAPPAVEVLGAVETRVDVRTVQVVRVVAQGCGGRSTGSGVVVGEGAVLTARHVLDGATEAEVVLDTGERIPATVVAVARDGRDSALLDAPALAGVSTVPRSAEGLPAAGSTVAAIGHPDGGAAVARSGAFVGTLDGGPLAVDGGRVLTLDVAIDEGMSGGPVVDADGRLLGVAIAFDRATRTGIAVPIDAIGDLLEGDGDRPRPSC